MDDDVLIETECILRTATFFSLAANGVALGGQMLRLEQPTVIHESGGMLLRRTWRIVPMDRGAEASSHTVLARLSQLQNYDFNSWFYFAVSLDAVRRVGLPLPLFILFDDVEYGLRLAKNGIAATTIPGIAVWHETGSGRDGRWRTYYYQRNALVVNALYKFSWPIAVSAKFVRHWLWRLHKRDLTKPALACQALRDYLAGPRVLAEDPSRRSIETRRFCIAITTGSHDRRCRLRVATQVVLQGLCLCLRFPLVDSRWRKSAPSMTTVAWWEEYLNLRSEESSRAP
jgi:galactofuranosylgalactofuranosylrhamnosyl-N-acetylglucosaminyl-diphospho-decaprenol beta-1,5/1,6-galactofuranosyltransferase